MAVGIGVHIYEFVCVIYFLDFSYVRFLYICCFLVLESQISLHDEEFPCSSLHDEEGDKLYIRFGGNMVKSRRDTLL